MHHCCLFRQHLSQYLQQKKNIKSYNSIAEYKSTSKLSTIEEINILNEKTINNFIENLKNSNVKFDSEFIINLKNDLEISTKKNQIEFLKTHTELELLQLLNNSINKPINVSAKDKQAWAEYHWYWVIYWRLHLDHNDCNVALDVLSDVATGAMGLGDAVEVFAAALPETAAVLENLAIGLYAVVAFCYVNMAIINHYDNGKGVWFGIFGIIPDAGWGSN